MIWDSKPWKDELLSSAEFFKELGKAAEPEEDLLARFEREVMVGFFMIRKLHEANKVADEIIAGRVPVEVFPRNSTKMQRFNWERLDHHYDMEADSRSTLNISDLSNQLIHSYIFATRHDESLVNGLLFASDWKKDTNLYQLDLQDLIKVFTTVGTNYPSGFIRNFDPKTGKETVQMFSSRSKFESTVQSKSSWSASGHGSDDSSSR